MLGRIHPEAATEVGRHPDRQRDGGVRSRRGRPAHARDRACWHLRMPASMHQSSCLAHPPPGAGLAGFRRGRSFPHLRTAVSGQLTAVELTVRWFRPRGQSSRGVIIDL